MNKYKAILEALKDIPNKTKGSNYSKEDAKTLGDKLGVDWDKVDLDQLRNITAHICMKYFKEMENTGRTYLIIKEQFE